MRVAVVRPKPLREPLPEPPFILHLWRSPKEDWQSFLAEYPELSKQYRWRSGTELNRLDYKDGYRFFHADGRVARDDRLILSQSRTVVRWPT